MFEHKRNVNYLETLRNLEATKLKSFYELLLFELTIVGRAIWSDPDLSNEEKFESLKWLNEINHRVLNGHRNTQIYFIEDLLASLWQCSSPTKTLKGGLCYAIKNACKTLISSQNGSQQGDH